MPGASSKTFVTSLLFLSVVGCTGVSSTVHIFLRHVRRSSHVTPVLLSPPQQQEVVDVHNAIRRQEMATDMRAMEWHPGLAVSAREAAENCVWTSRSREELRGKVAGFDTLTESVYVSADRVGFDTVIRNWAKEKDGYQFHSGQCNKVCYHYTQIVWSNTPYLGCAVTWCSTLQNSPWGTDGGYLFVCVYGPGGNTDGARPYLQGETTCSNCTGDFRYCWDGLCKGLDAKPNSASRPGSLIGGYLLVLVFFNRLFSHTSCTGHVKDT